MKETTEAIYDVLSTDSTLLAMLTAQVPFNDPNGTASTKNSIVPSDIVKKAMSTPLVSIQEGSRLKIGSKLISDTVFIRCYNEDRKSYIEINNIIDRIITLLDGVEITIEDKVLVELNWEATLPGLRDEPLGMKFKEARFRILVL